MTIFPNCAIFYENFSWIPKTEVRQITFLIVVILGLLGG